MNRMADLIDRQAAIDAIDKIFPADPMRNDYTQGITCGAALATEYIKQLPSAEQERKNGKWIDAVIPNDNRELLCQVCDQCNTFFPLAYTGGGHNFCPNCGADMRGEWE